MLFLEIIWNMQLRHRRMRFYTKDFTLFFITEQVCLVADWYFPECFPQVFHIWILRYMEHEALLSICYPDEQRLRPLQYFSLLSQQYSLTSSGNGRRNGVRQKWSYLLPHYFRSELKTPQHRPKYPISSTMPFFTGIFVRKARKSFCRLIMPWLN